MYEYAQWYCQNISYFTHAKSYGLAQDCSKSIAKALELLQSCTKQTKYSDRF